MELKTHKIMLHVEVEVEPIGDADPPDLNTIMDAWMDACGGELLSRKVLAECGFPAFVTPVVQSWERAKES